MKTVKKLTIGLAWLAISLPSLATPSLEDFWRLECAPNGITKDRLEDIKEKADDTDETALKGIATMKYACAMSVYELQRYAAMNQAFITGKTKKKPTLQQSASNKLKKRATTLMKKSFKAEEATSEFLYHYGFGLAFAGDEWGVNRFDEAARKGDGEYAEKAKVALADFLVQTKGVAKGREYYESPLKSSSIFVQGYAKYKVAWLEYVLAAQKKSLAGQYAAIQSLGAVTSLKGKSPLLGALVKLAREDMVNLLVEHDNLDKAKQILQAANAQNLYGEFLQRKGDLHIEKGDINGAYKLMLAAYAVSLDGPDAPNIELTLAFLEARLNKLNDLTGRLKRLPQRYVDEDSKWVRRQRDGVPEAVRPKIMQAIYDYATGLDADGRKAKDKKVLASALSIYELFLKTFPKSKLVYDAKFYYGQLLFLDEKYDAAANQFDELYDDYPKGKHKKETLDFLVSARKSSVDFDTKDYKLPMPGEGKKEVDLPKNRTDYINALNLFMKANRSDKNVPAMKFIIASIYYDFAHYDDANDQYMKFLKVHPRHEFAPQAVTQLITHTKLQDPDDLEDLIEDLSEIPDLVKNKAISPMLQKPKK